MRGLRRFHSELFNASGITPAHAGLTINKIHILKSIRGSPPRMRGLPCISGHGIIIKGITPAHAGLTMYFRAWYYNKRDHPRACGAYRTLMMLPLVLQGSPPRMRGLLSPGRNVGAFFGITPAHAGLTYPRYHHETLRRDHPRACGAYGMISTASPSMTGSPPRMRGLQ